MAEKEKTVGTNPLKLLWPSDRQGITQKLQREGCRAIGRMGADAANYDMVMEVLRVLAAHAKEKLAAQKVDVAAVLAKASKARTAAAVVNAKSAEHQRMALENQIGRLTNKLKAVKVHKT